MEASVVGGSVVVVVGGVVVVDVVVLVVVVVGVVVVVVEVVVVDVEVVDVVVVDVVVVGPSDTKEIYRRMGVYKLYQSLLLPNQNIYCVYSTILLTSTIYSNR